MGWVSRISFAAFVFTVIAVTGCGGETATSSPVTPTSDAPPPGPEPVLTEEGP
ncbi:MAG: hypothetical protein H6822_34195 [Planctomycetaceae bacterium]|nr:hypothetical protein [Planctomycetales bacterium]MCB9927237.1 hypothetical protein [Planctomycetaceae bacterium]